MQKGSLEHDVFCTIVTLNRFTYTELSCIMGVSSARLKRAVKSLRQKGVLIQTTGGGRGSRMEQERFLQYKGHLPPKQKRGLHGNPN